MPDNNDAPKPFIPGIKPAIPGVNPSASEADAGDTSRTVRLKPITVPPPVSAPPSITSPIPGADPLPGGPRAPTPAQVQAAKSKTSRISLEQAISMDSQTPRSTQSVEPANVLASPAPGAPRTIRLKRPTEMPTLKVNAVPPPTTLPGAAKSDDASPTLSTVDADAGGEDPDSAVTQKRKLTIKRPGAPSISIAGGAAAAAKEGGGDLPEGMTALDPGMMPLVPMAPPERGNAFFLVAAIFAILVSGGIIGFFMWQLYGTPSFQFWFQQFV